MRGLALLGMLAWHAQVGWVKGGFARMTIFFVLAGYLATTSQLRLMDGSGGARPFVTFWSRRARRLLPITVLGVLVAVAVTATVGGAVARGQAAGDTASVLFSVSNWRFILSAREYGAMFETSSAFQHFWSLSVEEQCFIVLPIVLAASLAATRRLPAPRRAPVTAALLVATGALLAATPLVVTMSADAAYYSTVVRGGEFLAGAAFAVWWERGRRAPADRTGLRRWDVAGCSGLAVLVVVMLTMERESEWLYRGGMGLFAVPAVALLGGIVAAGPIVNRVLGVRPLELLGRWAFPIYVLHWPLYLVLGSWFDRLDHAVLVVVQLAASIALGAVVHRWIERPLLPVAHGVEPSRVARWLWAGPRRVVPVWGGAIVLCLLASVAVPAGEPPVDFATAEEEQSAELSPDEARELLDELEHGPLDEDDVERILGEPGAAPTGLPVFRDPGRRGVGLFGGSTALSIALGGGRLAELDEGSESVPGYAPLGCGLLDEGVRGDRSTPPHPEAPNPVPEQCRERELRWAATAVAHRIDVAVVAASLMEVVDWQLPGDSTWRALGDPVLDARVEHAMRSTVAAFEAVGVERVVLLTPIPPHAALGPERRDERQRRQDVYSDIARRVAADTDAVVVDLAAWFATLSEEERDALTPDGVHAAQDGARRIWDEVLAPAVIDHTL